MKSLFTKRNKQLEKVGVNYSIFQATFLFTSETQIKNIIVVSCQTVIYLKETKILLYFAFKNLLDIYLRAYIKRKIKFL